MACNPEDALLPKDLVASKVPARYRDCFAQVAKVAPGTGPNGDYTTQDLWVALGTVKTSELSKTECGRGLITWTEGQLRAIKGK